MKVFIDGENMRHRLVSALYNAHLITDSEELFTADIRALVEGALNTQVEDIRYYTTSIHQPDFEIPEKLHNEISSIERSHTHWIEQLKRQRINVVVAGILKVHENAPCYHCGRRTMVLQEKGVDVRMATEMVMAAVHEAETHIVVMSSDADMIPALEIVKRSGARITYLCFAEEENETLKRIADDMVTYSREDILHISHSFKPESVYGD